MGRLEQSARQAKRLLASQQEHVEEEDLIDEEESKPATRSAGFAFLLNDSSSEEEEDEDEEEEEVEEEERAVEQHKETRVKTEPKHEEQVTEAVEQLPCFASSNKAKKRNAKKKNQKKKKQPGAKDESINQVAVAKDQDEDALLDALVANANELAVEERLEEFAHDPKHDLLAVQMQFLNADKEMKRIFGVRDRDSTASDIPGRSNRRNNVARRTTKRVVMVTPLDEWPRPPTFVGGGIRWTRANRPDHQGWDRNCQYFEIDWSIAYKKLQDEFEAVQRTHDPNVIGLFLQRYPFHVDALLQMSEVFQHHGQMDHASDCIKRCIYLFELAWAEQFDVSKGNCRMSYNAGHNDGFFRALFLYMKQVGRRGCLRSAFEMAKLILSLDPNGDPMNVLLCLDYYALSARQYDFVAKLADTHLLGVDRFAKVQASSKAPLGKESKDKKNSTTLVLPTWQFSLALAKFHLGQVEEAKELLTSALLRFPSVLGRLVDKCGIKTSCAPWNAVVDHMVFANCELACSLDDDNDVKHLLGIYVARHFSLWKVNEVQTLLLQAAQQAMDRRSATMLESEREVLELPAALKKYRRAALHDYSDEITTLPPDHPMMRPPELPQELDAEQLAALADMQEQMQQGNLPADANPLLLFLQTLLPWNRVQQGGGGQHEPGADAAHPAPRDAQP